MKTRFLKLYLVFCLILTICINSVYGQKPDIKSIDKAKAEVGELVTIKGDNFGGDASRLVVFFGGVKGSILSASNQVIEVTVPPGTTYNSISVTNLLSGLTGYTSEQFLLSYGGLHPFQTTNLGPQLDFAAEKGLYDLCLCDFDGDNRDDVATASDNATAIKILPNTSSGPGNINFNVAAASLPLGTRSLHSKCGDLNGDGKPDLVVSESGGDRLFIFMNTSTGTGNFNFTPQSFKLTSRKTKRIEIADLDRDGKPELIVSDQGSNIISVLINQSTTASVIFSASPLNFTLTGATSTDGLAVEDINGDFLPEIVASQFLTATSNLFIVQNKSIPGTITLGPVITQPLPTTVVNVRIGDLDGDGKADIAATQLLSSSVAILLNTSTTTGISFASSKSFVTDERPWGIDIGDLDGDAKADIVVASITKKTLTVLNNESTVGNLSFQSSPITTTYINRHVNIGDLDSDGKPEIVFTSIDDNNTGILASKVSVFRNQSCMVPVINPAGPVSVCSGTPLRLNATVSRGTTYQWKNESTNTVVASGTNPFFDVTTSGKYSVTAIAEGGTCSKVSNIVDVTVSAGSVTGTLAAINNGPLCVGNTLELSVTGVVSGATDYKWTGPNGFTASGNPVSINSFGLTNVGRYYVDVMAGGCVAQQLSTIVEAIDIGSFTVTYPGSRFMCQGDSKTLTVSPNLSGASYQWYESTSGLLSGQTSTTLTVTATGNYYVQVTYPGCSTSQTEPVNIVVATLPVADFDMPAQACTGQLVKFINQSASDPSATAEYLWTFGDGNTSTLESPEHSYVSANTFNVKLRVSYTGGVCPNETPTKPISVQAAPIPVITNPDGKYEFCPGESLKLEVLGSYTSYKWSTDETTSSINVTEAGTYTVEVTTAACTLNASRSVTTLPAPTLLVSADPANISEGQSSQLNVEGIITYLWSPDESLSNSTIRDPVANPTVTTTYTVTGEDVNGCMGEGSVEVTVKGDVIVNKLKPEPFFSPNNDNRSENWEIENIIEYPQCEVVIYDDKGARVYESKPYLNNWNGSTTKGKQLPDGVYYYIIRCDGEENTPKTGSITILR
ncbi:MAG TPA: FG-GAP-like repeat-containing protein [Cyclobacteriaceae bacterium]|nr:FG-GAP-like repeat-containing protein [Cyclobacteriaceae bacterium]